MIFEKRHIFFALLLILIGVIFWSSGFLQSVFAEAQNFIETYIHESPILAVLVFVMLAVVAVVVSPFSSAPLVPLVIPAWGESLTIVLLVSGWLIGGIIIYFIGSALREPFLSHTGTTEKIEYYKSHISGRAQFGLVVLFRFAIPSEIAGYVLGIVRYHFGKYVIATITYEIFSATTLVYLSDAFLAGNPFYFIVMLGVMLGITGASLYTLRRKMRKHASS
ncbi:MAG: hypothetical protein COU47_01380 [Candidatus Niyogibacteria bacterium CG10_big_fil_rev_8_21_14_0_10_46_36]|uniref:VTT domain-containing protein n=1 Tax=Candidatus Niyogibacteria bacterium CG10_big_fil_rev_8_21_14_0_10_46_36 TaxID=1974726 RepID=A0A2H0TDU0_9BACT|nr:MAG: hypothetical protein COU47_01380 [Candidatus Niyogibacteria bacterium CG10_big_fil_rev_8_21_14_0_10_46_36]